MDLATKVYDATSQMPKDETYGLRAQIRSSAVSIPSNIAEGCGRGHAQELIRFVGIANGSLLELETQLEIGVRTGMLREIDPVIEDAHVVGRMLANLRRTLEAKAGVSTPAEKPSKIR